MPDSDNLLKISLLVSLCGILLLLFLSNNLEPKLISIKDIDNSKIEKFVKIEGNITQIREYENNIILTVKEGDNSIKIVLFEKAEFEKGMQVEIIGKVAEYRRELEIDASRIKEIK